VLTKLLKLTSIVVIVMLVSSPAFAAGGGLWLMAVHDLRNSFQNTENSTVAFYEYTGMALLPLGFLPVARKVVSFL
jgi:hypothetical protein